MLVTLSQELVHAQNIADSFANLELVIFVSRHSSTSATPTLSVHTPGNLGNAQLGGIPHKVSISPANAMRTCLQAMMKAKKKQKLDYEVSYEGTHHGPSLDVPAMFAELGSSPLQWNDTDAAKAVAEAVMETVSAFGDSSVETVLGIGGTHYNAKFTRMALESEVAFGHMIPKYAVPGIDPAILRQCTERTMERVARAILDWKGIRGQDKQSLIKILKKLNLPFEKV